MKEKQLKYDDLCVTLNMTYQSLHKRIKGIVDFKLKEINIIRKTLGLTMEQADEIFYYDTDNWFMFYFFKNKVTQKVTK